MDSPYQSFRVPQDRESPTPATWEHRERFSWRYAYARAAETQSMGEVGQDCIVMDPGTTKLVFALADGVSQSFFGDLAATALGDGLVKWLNKLPSGLDRAGVQSSLESYLERLRQEVTEEVEIFPLPKSMPAMLAEVLEQKRQLGSESMFVAGKADLGEGRLLLTWLGDMRCRIWNGEQELAVGGLFRTEDRWSSRRGPVAGPPQIFLAELGDLSRVVVYSDGLAALDSLPQPPSDDELHKAIEDSRKSPTSDDISFLDVILRK